jgi:hypothetical protein
LQDELKTAMDMIGETVTDVQLNELLQIADIDRDGKINYEGQYSDVTRLHLRRCALLRTKQPECNGAMVQGAGCAILLSTIKL